MKSFTSSLLAAAAMLYMTSSVSAQSSSAFPAPRPSVDGITGALLNLQTVPNCDYLLPNGTTGTPVLYNLYATANASTVVNATSNVTDVCYVWDPLRTQSPWSGSAEAWPQLFDPTLYVCTATNFLCPIDIPFACGRQCFSDFNQTCIVNQNLWFSSYTVPSIKCTSGNVTIPPPPAASNISTSYPTIFVDLAPTGSNLSYSLYDPTSSSEPTPTSVSTSSSASSSATTSTVPAVVPAVVPTSSAAPITANSLNSAVVPSFQPIGTAAPAKGRNSLLHRLARFF